MSQKKFQPAVADLQTTTRKDNPEIVKTPVIPLVVGSKVQAFRPEDTPEEFMLALMREVSR